MHKPRLYSTYYPKLDRRIWRVCVIPVPVHELSTHERNLWKEAHAMVTKMNDTRSVCEKHFDVFRKLFTEGFYAVDPETGERLTDDAHQKALDSTKPWRNTIWKAINQLERDTNPYVALKHKKALEAKAKDNDKPKQGARAT